jgi:hypothetical protein
MVIDINNTNILFMPVTYYTIKGENEAIERITINGEELNLKSDEDLVKAIDSLSAAKKSAMFSDDETSMLDIFGAGFGNQMTELSKHFNEITEDLIYKIENMRIALRNANGCNKCDLCSSCNENNKVEPDCELGICPEGGCSDCTFNDAEIEATKASDAVEAVANTRTFKWAQKYMDEVIDPASELSGPEYNTLLAMFTQYGEWILNQ